MKLRVVRERTPMGFVRFRVNPRCQMALREGECGKDATERVTKHRWSIFWCPEHAAMLRESLSEWLDRRRAEAA